MAEPSYSQNVDTVTVSAGPLYNSDEAVVFARPAGPLYNSNNPDRMAFDAYMSENYPDQMQGSNYFDALDTASVSGMNPLDVYQAMSLGDSEAAVEIGKRSGYALPVDMQRVTSLSTGDKRASTPGLYFPEIVGDRSFSEIRGRGLRRPDFFPAENQMKSIYDSMSEYEAAFGNSPTPNIVNNPEMFTEGDQIFTIGPGGMDPQTLAHEFYHRSGVREEKPIYTMSVINAQTPLEYKQALMVYAGKYRKDLLNDSGNMEDGITPRNYQTYLKLQYGEDTELPSGLEKNVLLDITERPYRSRGGLAYGGLNANKSVPSQMVFEEFAQGKRGPRNEDTQDTIMGGIADFFGLKDTPTKVELLDDLYEMRVTDSIFGKRRAELLTEPSFLVGELAGEPDYGYDTDYFMKDSTANPENLPFNKLMRTAEPRTLINRDYAEANPDLVEYQRNVPQITEEEIMERFLDLRASKKTGYTGDRQRLRDQGLKSLNIEQENVPRGTSEDGIGEIMNRPRTTAPENSRKNAATAKIMRQAGLPVKSERDASDIEPEILKQLDAIMGRSSEE